MNTSSITANKIDHLIEHAQNSPYRRNISEMRLDQELPSAAVATHHFEVLSGLRVGYAEAVYALALTPPLEQVVLPGILAPHYYQLKAQHVRYVTSRRLQCSVRIMWLVDSGFQSDAKQCFIPHRAAQVLARFGFQLRDGFLTANVLHDNTGKEWAVVLQPIDIDSVALCVKSFRMDALN